MASPHVQCVIEKPRQDSLAKLDHCKANEGHHDPEKHSRPWLDEACAWCDGDKPSDAADGSADETKLA